MSDPICQRCDHPLSAHCKGKKQHTCHKEDARMTPIQWRKGTTICKGRHCENAMCSCVEFVEPQEAA